MTTTQFKGNTLIGEASLSEALSDNVQMYVDWSFLQMGAYYNISIPTSGAWGGNLHKLYPVNDPRYDSDSSSSTHKIWRTYRGNWVWESGLANGTPIAISGIFINNVFHANDSSLYYVDYPRGQIVFNNEWPVGSSMHLAYSYKLVKVTDADAVPFFRKVQPWSLRGDDSNLPVSSGLHTELAESRLELPLVAIKTFEKNEYAGYEIGNGAGKYERTEVLFHVLAENDKAAKRIANILAEQHDATLFMFSPDQIADGAGTPLNQYGALNSTPLTYPDMIRLSGNGGYRYTEKVYQGKVRISDSRAQNGQWIHENLYHTTVRWTTEVVRSNI